MYAVELGKIEGLTFFTYKGAINAIHIHQGGQSSSALPTYRRLYPWVQDLGAWIYIPFHKSDRLKRFGVRQYWRGGCVVLLGTKMLGDIIFGIPGHTIHGTQGITSNGSLTLVYGEHKDDMLPVPFFGAFDKELTQPPPLNRMRDAQWPGSVMRTTREQRRAIPSATITSAPLAGVVSVTVFYIGETENCRGLLFTYENGGQRTVGQCRVGLDRCTKLESLAGLCF